MEELIIACNELNQALTEKIAAENLVADNKAMSAAYKYMAILTFCIPTEGENDPDFHSYEVAPKTLAKPTAIKPAKIAASNEPPAGWKPAYR